MKTKIYKIASKIISKEMYLGMIIKLIIPPNEIKEIIFQKNKIEILDKVIEIQKVIKEIIKKKYNEIEKITILEVIINEILTKINGVQKIQIHKNTQINININLLLIEMWSTEITKVLELIIKNRTKLINGLIRILIILELTQIIITIIEILIVPISKINLMIHRQ